MKIKKYIEFLNENLDWPDSKQGVIDKLIGLGWDLKQAHIHINDDLTIDSDTSVSFLPSGTAKKRATLPVKYGKINGYFTCANIGLTSLEGAPHTVLGTFNCANNEITSLNDGPTKILGNYLCGKNKLSNLIGAPQTQVKEFKCYNNNLTSLKGAPNSVKIFDCSNNLSLTSMEFCPQNIEDHLYIVGNTNLTSLIGIPTNLPSWKFIDIFSNQDLPKHFFEYADYCLEKDVQNYTNFKDVFDFHEEKIPEWFTDKWNWLQEFKFYTKQLK